MNGKLVPWDEANVHVLTHSLHYGLAAFEGIRCYKCDDGRSAVFRLREHMVRLIQSTRGFVTVEEVFDTYSVTKLTSGNRDSETARRPQPGDDVIKWPLF